MKMKALVTGAYGFVGSHMVRHALEAGYDVIATDHPKARPKPLPEGVRCVLKDFVDFADVKSLVSAEKPDVTFQIASVFNYAMPRAEILGINAAIAENICKTSLEHNPGGRIIGWGSSSIYGSSFGSGRVPLKENAPMLPRNPYEESKCLQYVIYRQYWDRLPITVIHPMAIYGPGGNYGAMVVIDMMAKNQLPGFPNGGKNRISLVHVTDVCRAALFLAGRDDTISKSYNLGDASSYTMKQMMRYLKGEFARLGVPVDLLPVSYPLWLMKLFAWRSEQLARKHGHPPVIQHDFLGYFEKGLDFLVDTSAIRSLGFRFLYDDPIRDGGLRETLEWQRKERLI